MEDKYIYDVAISFLNDDIDIARKINNRLSETYNTFVYFDRQKEIVGVDGEIKFNEVFGIQSRIVVVLYRDTWGSTPFTRIEETAIKNRGFEEGYDFLIIAKLDDESEVPQYYPKPRIWAHFPQLGYEGLVSSIEHKIKGNNEAKHDLNAIELIERMNTEKGIAEDKDQLLNSIDGVERSINERDKLYDSLKDLAEVINSKPGDIKFSVQKSPYGICYLTLHRLETSFIYELSLAWFPESGNSLNNTYLYLYVARRPFYSTSRSRDSEIVLSEKFIFDLELPDNYGWRSTDKSHDIHTSQKLADYCIRLLIEEYKKNEGD